MRTVTFLAPPFREHIAARAPSSAGSTLLSLARKLALPLRCECEQGRCGACAVKVAVLHRDGVDGTVRLSAEEKTLLYRAGKLTREQYESEVLADSPPLWRLACRYVVRDEDVLVAM